MEMYSFEMLAKVEAQDNAWSIEIFRDRRIKINYVERNKGCVVSSSILPNQSITFCVFRHWFTFKIVLSCVFILSKINLLIFPESLIIAGLISRHFGLFSKFSLWPLREIKASRIFMHSIRLPMERLSAMCFSSLSISEILSRSDPRLYVFVMLSCIL